MSQAFAGANSLQDATITATYNGLASGVLGVDHSFVAELGSNVTKLDLAYGDSGSEFFTSDYLFGVDFNKAGLVTFLGASTLPVGAYTLTFDFGSTLAEAISGFTLVNASAVTATPVLSVINDHAVSFSVNIDSAHTWIEASVVSAQLAFTTPVPEPVVPAMMLAGLGVLGLSRRFSKR